MKRNLTIALVFAISALSFALFQNATVSTDQSQLCTATDLNSWLNCKEQLKKKNIYTIVVNGTIHCPSDVCNLSAYGLASLTITSATSATFVREAGFGSSLFLFSGVKEVHLSNITIKEPANIPEQPESGASEINVLCKDMAKSQCAPTVNITSAKNAQIRNLNIYNGKRISLAIANSSHVLVDSVHIDDAFHFGSWVSKNEYLTFQNSSFTNNRSNAIIGDFSKSIETKILGNRFAKNHRATAFHVCGSSKTEPCPGGQIDLAVESHNIEVAYNIFENAKMSLEVPEDKAHNWISGVEFESKNISNVEIHDNIIRNNSGSEFFVNMPNIADPNIQLNFKNNRTCKNRTEGFNHIEEFSWNQDIVKSGNVTDCSDYTKSKGYLSISPEPCIVKSGKNSCSIQLAWKTQNAPYACLFIASSRKVVACSSSNKSLTIDWISKSPVKFELRAERNYFSPKLAEVTVKPIVEVEGKPHILNAGLGCADQECVWTKGFNVEKGCFVNIYNTDYVKLVTINNPSCERELVTFRIPSDIVKKHSRIVFNVVNPNKKWSNSFAVSLTKK